MTTTPNGPCPSCGHCPTCGRTAAPYYIQYVPYYPYTPNGYAPQWYGTTYVTTPSVAGSAWTYTLQAAPETTGTK